MKTRSCKLSLLVIFLALCFAIYVGNCYSQELPRGVLFDSSQWPGRQVPGISDSLPMQLYNLEPLKTYNPLQFYNQYISPISYQQIDYGWPLFDFYWQPSGITTWEFLQDKLPGINYDRFYNMEDIPGIDYDYGYFNFTMPIENSLNVYQRPDIYALPLSQIHKLYNFTKGFTVQPIMPDIWVGYGAGMSMSNYGTGYQW